MTSSELDGKGAIAAIRRHKLLVGGALVVGLIGGLGYSLTSPPTLTSTALVVLPNGPYVTTESATEVLIASSTPVLSMALPEISPRMSLSELQNAIVVDGETETLVSITASAESAAGAESAANAVARSYVSYMASPSSPVGEVTALVLQSATSAAGKGKIAATLPDVVLGAIAGALVGILVALWMGRRKSRLTGRGAIADSIGVPVLAAIPVGHPDDAASWASLLREYQPTPVYTLRLRQVLQQLGALRERLPDGQYRGRISITMLSLSSDPGAVALGPQLAVFATSMGIPTALVVGLRADDEVTPSLRVACSRLAGASGGTVGKLQVIASAEGLAKWQSGFGLAVHIAVIDGNEPRAGDLLPTSMTVLGVSAGVASAQELARVAVAAAESGHDPVGILVADPDPNDDSIGLEVSFLRRLGARKSPTRLNGNLMEVQR